jgi:hypothetical protein
VAVLNLFVYCRSLFDQSVLVQVSPFVEMTLRAAASLYKSDQVSKLSLETQSNLHRVLASAVALFDAMPSIDHFQGRKLISLVVTHSLSMLHQSSAPL